MKLYKTKEVAEMLKLHPTTLTYLAQQGKVKPKRVGHQYRWSEEDIKQLLNMQEDQSKQQKTQDEKTAIVYARVSGNLDTDLSNQVERVKDFAVRQGLKIVDVITDKASSFNFRRRGLVKLLDSVLAGDAKYVVVYSRDRLSRIAFDLFEVLFEKLGVKIIVVDDSETCLEFWQQKDLVDELTSFLHYITSKMYGLHKYRPKVKEIIDGLTNDKDLQAR